MQPSGEHIDFDARPLTDLERDAAIRMLYQRDALTREHSQLARMRENAPNKALQNRSSLSVYLDDETRRELFIADVGKRLVANGTEHTTDYLRTVFRFSRAQAKAVIDEARRELAYKLQAETELLRSVAIARLESIMRRARDACDLMNEIRATKEWLRVVGAYSSQDGAQGDLAALMRELSKLEGPDPTKIVDAEFTVEGEEEEATHWQAPEDFAGFEEESPD